MPALGPNLETDGVVRCGGASTWPPLPKSGVEVDEDTVGRLLRELGFSHISERPKHPNQKNDAIADFNNIAREAH
jgi:hypothetical protein